MFSCNYNGWADVPEEEREGIDSFEAHAPASPPAFPVPRLDEPMAVVAMPASSPAGRIIRKAA